MVPTYNLWLVALSVAMAFLASFVALDLAQRVVRSVGRAVRWMVGGAFSMGLGIWSMHFIGMLAFHLPVPVSYDLPITLASMLPAVLASMLALYVVRRENAPFALGAALMGMGIASMHYIGMAAMKMQPPIRYDHALFALSVLIAVLASYVALRLAFTFGRADEGLFKRKLASAAVMGGAISGMHYTAMAAAIFEPGSVCLVGSGGMAPSLLAVLTGSGTFLILSMTIVISAFDSKMADQSAKMVEKLKELNEGLQKRAEELAEAMTEEIRSNAAKIRLLSTIVDQSGEAIITKDLDGRITSWNSAAARMFGYEAHEAIGLPERTFHPPGHEWQSAAMLELVRSGETHTVEGRRMTRSGETIEVSATVSPLFDEEGVHVAGIGILRDITSRKRAEEELQREKERAEVTLASIGDAVITTDEMGRVDFMNQVAEDLTGWKNGEARGLPLCEVFRIENETTREPVENPVEKCLREGKVVGLANHTVLIDREGEEVAIDDSAAPIRDGKGNIIGVVMVFHDVSDSRKMSKALSWQASHDFLTGLSNRLEFERRLGLVLEGGEDVCHSLLYFDLDQFKVVNDTCGHVAGDELLKQIPVLLRDKIRESDMLARLGGDEFGLLLLNCPREKAFDIAQSIRGALNGYRFVWQDKTFSIGASVGLVNFRPGREQFSDILSRADVACYAAKEAGRGRVHVYEEANAELTRQHNEMQWVSKINHALAEDRFTLFFQPIVRIGEDRGEGRHCEILIRMVGEDGALIPPMAFIPAAERFGLMSTIDRWVVKNLFGWISRSRDLIDPDALFSVNVSGGSIGDEAFSGYVLDEMESNGVPPQMLCFEITETAAIANLSMATEFIARVRAMGCRFSLDDFGSGLSSFAYLKALPVDFLKIDGSFVRDIVEDPVDYAMVEAITKVARVMGISTIAEFVENVEILEMLGWIGVDFAQGYGIAVPQRLA